MLMATRAAIGVLFETGGSAVVSEKIGAGNKNLSEQIMRSNYLCAMIIGIIVAVVGNIFIEQLLMFLSDHPDEQHIIDLAISFLRISFCGLPFLLTVNLTGAFMRCIDKPSHVFCLVGSTSLANIILDALFIIAFGWGMEGAAFATVLAQFLGTLISFWYLFGDDQASTGLDGDFHLALLVELERGERRLAFLIVDVESGL